MTQKQDYLPKPSCPFTRIADVVLRSFDGHRYAEASVLQAGLIECGATALFLFFTIGTITSGDARKNSV